MVAWASAGGDSGLILDLLGAENKQYLLMDSVFYITEPEE